MPPFRPDAKNGILRRTRGSRGTALRMDRPRIALALGSGAARGWAHIGVIRALEAEGVDVDIICGTSVGALVGGVWQAGQLSALEHWARSLNRGRILRYLDVSITGSGLIGGKRLARLLQDRIGDRRVEDLAKPFAAVATELATGHEIWLQHGQLVPVLQAAYALPGIFPPARLDGRWVVDGALVNPVPVSVCRALGARLVIAVNLNADLMGIRRRSDRGQNAPSDDELDSGRTRDPSNELEDSNVFTQLFGQSEGPSMFSVMVSSLNILQDRLSRSRLAGDPPDVTIAPRLGHIGLLEFDRADEAMQEGADAVQRSKPFLSEALGILGF